MVDLLEIFRLDLDDFQIEISGRSGLHIAQFSQVNFLSLSFRIKQIDFESLRVQSYPWGLGDSIETVFTVSQGKGGAKDEISLLENNGPGALTDRDLAGPRRLGGFPGFRGCIRLGAAKKTRQR